MAQKYADKNILTQKNVKVQTIKKSDSPKGNARSTLSAIG